MHRNFAEPVHVGVCIVVAVLLPVLLLFVGFAGHGHECAGNVTVTFGVFVKIVLMILLGFVKVLQWFKFHGKWLANGLLNPVENILQQWQLCSRGVVHSGAVACARVLALTVERCGVDGAKEQLGEQLQGYLLGVVDNMYGLGISGSVGIHLLVCG